MRRGGTQVRKGFPEMVTPGLRLEGQERANQVKLWGEEACKGPEVGHRGGVIFACNEGKLWEP